MASLLSHPAVPLLAAAVLGAPFVPLIKNASLWRMPAYSHEHDILGDHRPFDILANPFPPYCSIQNLIGSACWRYKSLH